MVALIQTLGQNILQDLLDLLERATAPWTSRLLELKRLLEKQARFIPPGFLPLALAGSLFIAVAGLHELVREHGGIAPRPRTHLRVTKIAYASGYAREP